MKAIRLIVIAAITLVVGVCAFDFLLTGTLFPRRIVEKLNHTRKVTDITAAGFVTEDGDLIKVKYVSEIPTNLAVIRVAVANGIEVDAQGQTFGLLKIWHWCGNDPVRYHIARVNLSNLILASGGKPDPGISQTVLNMAIPKNREMRYGEHGLNISDFYRIRLITDMIEKETEQSPGSDAQKAAPQK